VSCHIFTFYITVTIIDLANTQPILHSK